jgi:hypothetical protein
MSKIEYSATFHRVEGRNITITRKVGIERDYTVAWCVVDGDAVVQKGFSRHRDLAERAAYDVLKEHVRGEALFAPVEMKADVIEAPQVPRRRQVPQQEAAE